MNEPLPQGELLYAIDLGPVPLTPTDYLFVTAAASERGMSLAAFVRDAVIREAHQ